MAAPSAVMRASLSQMPIEKTVMTRDLSNSSATSA